MVFITGLGLALAVFFVVILVRRYCVRFSVLYFIVPEWRKLDRREHKLAYKASVRALGWRNWIPVLALPFMAAPFWFKYPYNLMYPLTIGSLPLLLGAVVHRAALRRACWATLAARGEPICATCGYDLTGNVSGRCPECGQETKPKE